ncbi:glutamate racemase [Kouleothrix sp.]|uniref:glutamate racemase n=1 Tax=Kouleothrix sp. TaxID=2779161 RepID=UPI00391A9A69
MTLGSHPIGIFDSGIGGATVLRQLQRLLPYEDLLFLADHANCPYGARPAAELRALSAANTRWLLDRGAKQIVVACNTASAAALHWLRREFAHVPFVGMVPAVKPAAAQTRSGVVGVLATPTTIRGALLDEVVLRWAGGAQVLRQGCPGLVERIEAGELNTPSTLALLETYLRPLLAAGADTLVLGCTHYPFLAPQIQQIAGSHVRLLDAAPAVARQAGRVLAERGLLRPVGAGAGAITYATTGDTTALAGLISRLALPPGLVVRADTTAR